MESVELAKRRKDELDYVKLCHEADVVICEYGDTPINKWRRQKDIVAYLRPLKRAGDGAMPTSRSAIEKRYHEWKGRCRCKVLSDDEVMNNFNLWLDEKNK